MVVGRDSKNMFKVFKVLEMIRGGIVAVDKDKPVCIVHLEEAELMSSKRLEDIYREAKCLDKFFEERSQ